MPSSTSRRLHHKHVAVGRGALSHSVDERPGAIYISHVYNDHATDFSQVTRLMSSQCLRPGHVAGQPEVAVIVRLYNIMSPVFH